MTLCSCRCHKQPGPGYEGHPAAGDTPRGNLMIGLIGDNGALAVPAPYCWVCAYILTQRLRMIQGQAQPPVIEYSADPDLKRRAVEQMMRYANEGGAT